MTGETWRFNLSADNKHLSTGYPGSKTAQSIKTTGETELSYDLSKELTDNVLSDNTALSKDERYFAALSKGSVSLVDRKSQELVWNTELDSPCKTVEFSENSAFVLVTTSHKLYILSTKDGKVAIDIKSLEGMKVEGPASITPDNSYLISGFRVDSEFGFGIWSMNTGRLIFQTPPYEARFDDLIVSPDSKFFTGIYSGLMDTWKIPDSVANESLDL